MSIHDVNKAESTIILESMSNFLAGGSTILEAVEYTRDMFDGEHVGKQMNPYFMSRDAKLYRILQRIITETRDASIPIEESLCNFKVLNEDEKFVLQNPIEKPIELVKKILNERKSTGRFEALWKKTFRTTFWLAYITCIAMILYRDKMVSAIKESQTAFSVKADLEVGAINIVPYYLENEYFFVGVLIFFIGIYYGTAFFYRYYYKHDRRVIYKLPLFNLKAWDDVPVLLQLMHSIRKSGSKTTVKVFEILEENKSYEGLKDMFKRLQEHESIREPKFVLFEEYNFPKEVSLLIRARENTSSGKSTDFWYQWENFIDFAKSSAENKFNSMESKLQIVPMALPYFFPMAILTDLGNVYSSMMNMSGLNM